MVGENAGDTIILAGIEFRGHHGDSPEEQAIGGRYRVDVLIRCDTRSAEASDCLADTVDYYHVHKRILEIGKTERHRLLESLAGRIARVALLEFSACEVTVKVRKLLPPLEGIVEYAGVEITRRREDYGQG